MYIPVIPKISPTLKAKLLEFPIAFVNTKNYGNAPDCVCFLIDFAAFKQEDIINWTMFLNKYRPDELDIWPVDKECLPNGATHFCRLWWD